MRRKHASEPIVFISHQRIRPGKLDGYWENYQEVARYAEANKPGTLAHLAYVSQDGTEARVVHIFPDANAMAAHMQGVGEIARKAAEFMEIAGFEIYGDPGEAILIAMQKAGGGSIPMQVMPRQVGGYIRLKPG